MACEDTRRTARLLAAHGIRTPTTSYFEHNERWKGARILEALREGRDVALVSDAGTPGISDPGYRLVRDARAAGLPVVPVPGPSAAVRRPLGLRPAHRPLPVRGLPARAGPPRAGARSRSLPDRATRSSSTNRRMRVVELARGHARAALGDREAFLCREATKMHEEYRRGPVSASSRALPRARARCAARSCWWWRARRGAPGRGRASGGARSRASGRGLDAPRGGQGSGGRPGWPHARSIARARGRG